MQPLIRDAPINHVATPVDHTTFCLTMPTIPVPTIHSSLAVDSHAVALLQPCDPSPAQGCKVSQKHLRPSRLNRGHAHVQPPTQPHPIKQEDKFPPSQCNSRRQPEPALAPV